MIRRLSLLLAALLLFAPARAHANPEVLLRQAEKYYEQLEYVAALKILLALQQQKGVTPIQRARGYLYMGVCFTALGKAENAVQSFMEVVKIRPRFRLPSGVSPSIRAMFVQALRRLKLPLVPPPEKPKAPPKPKKPPAPPKSVDILAKAPLMVAAGKPVTVTIDIEDPGKRVKHLEIHWRRIGGPDYSTIKLPYKRDTATVEGTIPVAAVGKTEGRLVYYVEAKDAAGHVVARSATENEPQEIDLGAASDEGGTHWAWWAVGIVGGAALVAGGIVAAVLLTRGGDEPTTPGTATISVVLE